MSASAKERARALRAEGRSWNEIARELGVSPTTARRYADERFAEELRRSSREAKRRRTGVCRECGAETRYNGKGKAVSDLCVACNGRLVGEARRYWTRERILAAILDAAHVLGRTPGAVDFNPNQARNKLRDEERATRSSRMIAARRWPEAMTIYRQFGSFRAACKAAGLEPNPRYGTRENRLRRRSRAAA